MPNAVTLKTLQSKHRRFDSFSVGISHKVTLSLMIHGFAYSIDTQPDSVPQRLALISGMKLAMFGVSACVAYRESGKRSSSVLPRKQVKRNLPKAFVS